MTISLDELEDVVFTRLDDSDGVGLQPGDASNIVADLDEDEAPERITKILEHLSEESVGKRDRKRITTSLLQLLESYRRQDDEETSLADELFELARKAKERQAKDTTFLDKGIELVNGADDEVFEDADVTREDAQNFLLDIRNEVEASDQPHGVVVHALNNIGNAL